MEWLKKLIRKLLKKDEIKLIEMPKEKETIKAVGNNFKLKLKQSADPERDDRNGYKIIKNIRLRDMI